jgi:hypothetical protein
VKPSITLRANSGATLKSKTANDARRGENHAPTALLVASLFLFGMTQVAGPAPGLTASWETGINVASATGMHFGPDIIFTYGPLGFLDSPQSLSRLQIMLSMTFSLVATASLWTVIYVGIAKKTRHITAAAFATVLVGVLSGSGITMPSLLIFLSASIITLLYLKGGDLRHRAWISSAVSAVAAILLQIKFSEGIALIAVVGLSSIFSPSRTLRRIIESILALCATFAITWPLSGQRFEDVPSWLSRSLDVTLGYSEAMVAEIKPSLLIDLLSYLMAIILALTVMTLTMRWTATEARRVRLGIFVVVVFLLGFSFKQGFTRHDNHDEIFFAVTASLLAAFLVSSRRPWAVMGLIAASLVFANHGLTQFDPVVAGEAWKSNIQLLVDQDYQQTTLKEAAAAAKSNYALPAAIISSTKGHPVSVDPWEATLAWAYDFNWHPVPIFQAYSAYTATLDQVNADAILAAPHDQVVIRGLPAAFDGRNPMWETPRYLLALACNYVIGPSDDKWMTLRKSDQRCSGLSEETMMRVDARHPIILPVVRAGQILVGHFTPDAASVPIKFEHALWKDLSPLLVGADGREYRLPSGLADGPLLLHVPGTLGWLQAFGGGLDYKELVFSQSGTLKLETVNVRG